MVISRRKALGNLAAATAGAFALPKAFADDKKEAQTARYWRASGKNIQCELCPHFCILSNGQTGICRNRRNRAGILVALGYGLPCAIHVDPIEKKPLYHFLPGSRSYSLAVAGCNLRCKNCQNYSISQTSPLETGSAYRSPQSIVDEAKASGAASIAYTYSEPVVWFEYMLDIAKCARKAGIKNVLVSSGYINQAPLEELAGYLDGAHIDLKSFDDTVYRNLNAGKLGPVLNTIMCVKKKGVWVEIVNLVVPEWTDDLKMLREMAAWIRDHAGADTPLHFSRFFPLYQLAQHYPTPKDVLEKASAIAREEKLRYVYIGNVPEIDSNTYCHKCKSLLIKRSGYSVKVAGLTKNVCEKCGTTVPGVWS
ncbi:MAG: AmmeMemoRadiSam system radical SAM enzyme [Chitinispirillaceae bacterium]|nr:AmmeMemoRadiSam system radical SAM enzyme [Chitinispirillaceae bacterium]